jgi:hypothetical protein
MAAAELEVVVVAEEEVAVVVDITAHLGGTPSTANQLTRSASPANILGQFLVSLAKAVNYPVA